MSNLAIKMTGSASAQITFSAAREGDYLVAGDEVQHTINITDDQFLRRTQGEMFRLKDSDRDFIVKVKVGDGARLNLHSSIWHDLCDAILAFIMNIDVSKLLDLPMAA